VNEKCPRCKTPYSMSPEGQQICWACRCTDLYHQLAQAAEREAKEKARADKAEVEVKRLQESNEHWQQGVVHDNPAVVCSRCRPGEGQDFDAFVKYRRMEVEVKRLRERGNSDIGHYMEQELARVYDQVKQLRAIVDRLPKTADGFPIVPGMTVFIPHPRPSNLITEREVVAPYGKVACLTKEPAHNGCCESTTHRQARECYSTREAAEGAKGEG